MMLMARKWLHNKHLPSGDKQEPKIQTGNTFVINTNRCECEVPQKTFKYSTGLKANISHEIQSDKMLFDSSDKDTIYLWPHPILYKKPKKNKLFLFSGN